MGSTRTRASPTTPTQTSRGRCSKSSPPCGSASESESEPSPPGHILRPRSHCSEPLLCTREGSHATPRATRAGLQNGCCASQQRTTCRVCWQPLVQVRGEQLDSASPSRLVCVCGQNCVVSGVGLWCKACCVPAPAFSSMREKK